VDVEWVSARGTEPEERGCTWAGKSAAPAPIAATDGTEEWKSG